MLKRGFLFGLTAALFSGTVMLLARAFLGAPSIPEELIDLVTALTPQPLFSFLLNTLETWAKPLTVVGLSLLMLLLGAAGGVLWLWGDAHLLHRRQGGQMVNPASWRCWGYSLAFAGALWLLVMVLVLPAAGKGYFGSRFGTEIPFYWLAYSLIYGVTLASLTYPLPWSRLAAAAPAPADVARRRLLKKLALAVLGATVAAGLGRYLWTALGDIATKRTGQMPPEVTSNESFYTVSKNLTDPKVNSATWRLTLDGLVERPLTLTYQELKQRPAVTQYYTLMCISNGIGDYLIGNALWKGVPLRQLLEEAGVKDPALVRKVALFAHDEYYDSITLAKAMEPGTLIAYEMNGVPLPTLHGFPARLLVPGIYGMKNVKWLTQIKLVNYDFIGYWQEREWSDEAVYQTMSRIDVPKHYGAYTRDEIDFIGGIAYAGDWGIAQVEVSTDGGQTWAMAEVKEALSPYTWVLWVKEWTPPAAGEYTIWVRATDKTGELQRPDISGPLPWGATGLHRVIVHIS